jgi:lysophospholipase L1-like esterase
MALDLTSSKKLTLLCFLLFTISVYSNEKTEPDPKRFQSEIENFINWDKKNSFPKDAILFVGSSSIRLWSSAESYPEYAVINRGFGGAHISDVNYYYESVVKKYSPNLIVFYCGDNDIAAGKSAEQVYSDFQKFFQKCRDDFPGIKLIYLPIKPSLSRWTFWEKMKQVNLKIEIDATVEPNLIYVDTATSMLGEDREPKSNLFVEDGLHLNNSGYELWNSILLPYMQKYAKK